MKDEDYEDEYCDEEEVEASEDIMFGIYDLEDERDEAYGDFMNSYDD